MKITGHILKSIRTATILMPLLFASACASLSKPPIQETTITSAKPNIVLIIADDLGYSDIGVFGSEIETPHLDALANNGAMLTNFHANASCTPSRAMLLTGMDNHAVGFGANPGLAKRVPALRDMPGYSGEFDPASVTIAERLKSAGYNSLMAGKWHLGTQISSFPPARGYDRSFFLEHGGASHFSDGRGNLSREPMAHYYEGNRKVDILPEGFFSTTFYTDKMIGYMDESIQSKTPFFAHIAYTAPHWPLQAPDAWRDKYSGAYDAGWEAIRAARIKKMQSLGLLPADFIPPPFPAAIGRWESLSEKDKAREARTMELYAAMISQLDHEVGRIVAYLKEKGVYENTIIIFMSDNGPEGNNVAGIGDNAAWIPERFDMSYENMGRPGSYVWLGRAWAHVSAAPFRNYKTYLTEGGVRVPAIISAPGGRQATRIEDFVSVLDVMPTLLDAANLKLSDGPNLPGISILNRLENPGSTIDRKAKVSFEIYGARSVYYDQWKLLWQWPPEGQGRWILHDILADPGEAHDVSAEHPELVAVLSAAWLEFAKENGVYAFDGDMGYGRYPDQKTGE